MGKAMGKNFPDNYTDDAYWSMLLGTRDDDGRRVLIPESEVLEPRHLVAVPAAAAVQAGPVVPSLESGLDGEPQFLLGEREGLSDEEVDARLRDAFRHRPVFLSDLRAARSAGVVLPVPSIGTIEGTDRGWLYPGKSHSLSGEPGKGKTLLAQHTGFGFAEAGGGFLFLDYEKSWDAFLDRALLLGVSDDTASRVAYWSRPGALAGDKLETVIRFAVKFGLSFVVIDSVSRSMTAFGRGWSENSNDDVRAWYATAIDPMVQAGLTVLVIDHLSKPANERGWTPSRYAKGATDKLGVIDGAAFVLNTVEAFSAKQSGWAQLVGAKDNNGSMTEGEIVAEFHVSPAGSDGVLGVSFRSAVPVKSAPDGEFRPTTLMAKVSAFLAKQEEPVSKSKVIKSVGGNESMCSRAVDVLAMEGFATVDDQGPGKAKLVSHVSTYTVALDAAPAADRVVPFVGSGDPWA